MLILVATPIGNLKDITLRALETLKSVDYILAEDTRTSKKLLNHYEINTKLISFHKFNEKSRHEAILSDLKSGMNIALISDAGHPAICDPGSLLVKECLEENIEITINPGASALSTAISLSGHQGAIQFLGFVPRQKGQELLDRAQAYDGATLFYESGRRICKTLDKLNSDTQVMVLRELTKKFETLIKTSASEAILEVQKCLKGEFVLIIYGKPKEITTPIQELYDELLPYMSGKDAARLASKFTKTNKRLISYKKLS
jgi:16S rRNA (cytidine1402-2'-O)-methyltransferase